MQPQVPVLALSDRSSGYAIIDLPWQTVEVERAVVKTPRVYVDTSVIGGCCDPEFEQWSEGLLKDFEMRLLLPVISEIVIAEISDAPAQVQERFAELLDAKPEIIKVTPASEDLAQAYLAHGVLSANYSDDALHIALATIADVDILTSWNFRHIVHFDKIRMFNAVNLQYGYKAIQICSPREVTYHGNQDR
jgi:hypothetical protein